MAPSFRLPNPLNLFRPREVPAARPVEAVFSAALKDTEELGNAQGELAAASVREAFFDSFNVEVYEDQKWKSVTGDMGRVLDARPEDLQITVKHPDQVILTNHRSAVAAFTRSLDTAAARKLAKDVSALTHENASKQAFIDTVPRRIGAAAVGGALVGAGALGLGWAVLGDKD